MADGSKKPKVGVYDDAKTGEVSETTTTQTDTRPDETKGGGIPSWVIALIVVVLIIIALIYFL